MAPPSKILRKYLGISVLPIAAGARGFTGVTSTNNDRGANGITDSNAVFNDQWEERRLDSLTVSFGSILQTEGDGQHGVVLKKLRGERIPPEIVAVLEEAAFNGMRADTCAN